jgi:hypothetical protein
MTIHLESSYDTLQAIKLGEKRDHIVYVVTKTHDEIIIQGQLSENISP